MAGRRALVAVGRCARAAARAPGPCLPGSAVMCVQPPERCVARRRRDTQRIDGTRRGRHARP